MGDAELSQDEIDALLQDGSLDAIHGMDDVPPPPSKPLTTTTTAPRAQQPKDAEFRLFEDELQNRNLQLLLDIDMRLSVELGRSRMPVEQVLELARGSVVELDRYEGEPVDIRVNNTLVARGSIVAVDDQLAVTVEEVLDLESRFKLLN